MAYKVFEDFSTNESQIKQDSNDTKLTANGQDTINLPEGNFVQDSEMSRDGFNLILESNGDTITVEGYFAATPAPDLVGTDGMRLTAELVESFTHNPAEYADAGLSASDTSPIGAIQEISGNATITRADGTVEKVGLGTTVFQGDIVETDENGAVNIMFVDETTFAVSEDARLSIDEYVFDPATQSGTTNFSVLKGVFVFTSGLIGRDDPDDVMINTPSGSIGIRGTIIAGDVDTGEITVIEGAIVLHDFAGNSITLANQFETARFNPLESEIEHMGDLDASQVATKFMSVSTVAANLFSSIEDAANDSSNNQNQKNNTEASTEGSENQSSSPNEGESTQSQAEEKSDASNTEASSEDKPEESTETQSDTEGENEEGATLESNDDGTEQIDEQSTTQASSSESELTDIITSTEITDPDFGKLNNIVNKLKQQIIENNSSENSESSNEAEQTTLSNENTNDQLPQLPEVDRSPRLFDRAADEFFSGSNGTSFSYDFSQEFFDPFNTISGFTFSGIGSTDVNGGSVSFNNVTGELSFDLLTIGADDTFDFSITALSSEGTFTQDYTFNVLAENLNTTGAFPDIILNNGTVYNGNNPNGGFLKVNGQNVKVFADDTANQFDINSPNALIKAAGGDDIFDLGPSGNYNVYGEVGNDHFTINGGSLAAIYVNNGQIDGGTGYDTLAIGNNGNLDFRLVDANFVRNIEKLDFDNLQANNVTLTYSDVVAMTDDNNVLRINLDSGDNLNFINNTGTTFESQGSTPFMGDVYESFTDGNITILVDNTEGSVTGL